ncbi:MAG: MFS transporter [Tepidanaerobacteraceae bacterium]
MGSLILAISSILIAKYTVNENHFILFFGILVGAGMGLAGILTSQSAVNIWFDRHKAMAMAITLSAGGIGGFIAPQILGYILSLGSWEIGWYFICVMCTISLLLSIFVIINKPEDIGEVPDGRQNGAINNYEQINNTNTTPDILNKILRTQTVYLLIYCIVTRSTLYYTCIGHVVIYLVSNGIKYDDAALVISIISASSLIGRFATGFVADRKLKSNTMLALSNIIMAMGMILFRNLSSVVIIYFSAFVFGFGVGLGQVSQPLAISNYYGSNNFPVINGIIHPINYILSAIGPLTAGVMATTHSYNTIFLILSLLSFSGGLVMFYSKPYVPILNPIKTNIIHGKTNYPHKREICAKK